MFRTKAVKTGLGTHGSDGGEELWEEGRGELVVEVVKDGAGVDDCVAFGHAATTNLLQPGDTSLPLLTADSPPVFISLFVPSSDPTALLDRSPEALDTEPALCLGSGRLDERFELLEEAQRGLADLLACVYLGRHSATSTLSRKESVSVDGEQARVACEQGRKVGECGRRRGRKQSLELGVERRSVLGAVDRRGGA